MRVKLLSKNAKLPTRGSEQAAGFDLYSSIHMSIAPGESEKISTGLAIDVGLGNAGLIWPRSKISSKFSIDVLAGVIDSDYRGELMVCLINHGNSCFEIEPGHKIAQILIQKVEQPEVIEVDNLEETGRGAHGVNCDDLRLKDEN